jgi:hypothetical protein
MMRSTRASSAALGVAILALGCASSPSGRSPGYDRTRIGPDEIGATTVHVAYDLVRQLRPQWLTGRGPDSFRQPSEVVVYVDNLRTGGPAMLQQLSVAVISEITFLDAITATQRYGTGHASGAILVATRH